MGPLKTATAAQISCTHRLKQAIKNACTGRLHVDHAHIVLSSAHTPTSTSPTRFCTELRDSAPLKSSRSILVAQNCETTSFCITPAPIYAPWSNYQPSELADASIHAKLPCSRPTLPGTNREVSQNAEPIQLSYLCSNANDLSKWAQLASTELFALKSDG